MDKYGIDSEKLSLHPERVAQWRAAGDDWERAKRVYPIYVELSPVGACNHRCTFCAVDYLGYKPVLWGDRMMDVLPELGDAGVRSTMFGGEGEPTLHKRYDHFVLKAKSSGMDVALTTNATLLHNVDTIEDHTWIKASVNAGTEATYMAVHNAKAGDWERVWANLAEAVKRKGDCTIGVQMVLLPDNEREIVSLEARCRDAGVDYLVVKPYSQHSMSLTQRYKDWKPSILPYSSGITTVREAAFTASESDYSKCNATPNFWAFIDCHGEVCTCSAYLADPRFMVGNLYEKTFAEVWQGEKRRENWEFVRKTLDIHECRVNCRMHESNKYLAKFSQMQHVNFI